uniref:Uncharacterized protein n=1 Tax=Setaria digitata TaxID=48799 RepID=A0A915Q839_9BILA
MRGGKEAQINQNDNHDNDDDDDDNDDVLRTDELPVILQIVNRD